MDTWLIYLLPKAFLPVFACKFMMVSGPKLTYTIHVNNKHNVQKGLFHHHYVVIPLEETHGHVI